MECPRKVERRSGKLEAFDPTRGQSQARVRMGENLLMLPASARGVLQPDNSIVVCANGDRYHDIKPGTVIAIDMMLNANGEDPVPCLWAPKA